MPEVSSEQSSNTPQREMKTAHSLVLLAALTGAATCLFWRKHIYVNKTLNWTEAQTYCRSNYVDLSTIDTEEERVRFQIHVQPYLSKLCWIGLSKRQNDENFTLWSDGSVIGHIYWCFGKPISPGINHCVSTHFAALHDDNCTKTMHFFCYTWEPQVIVVQKKKTWEEALEHCRTYHTDLFSVSTEIDLYLTNKKSRDIQTASLWTGLRFLDGSWFWVNKEPLGNLVSMPSCPAQPFHCGAKIGADVWENRDCKEKMYFICYQ